MTLIGMDENAQKHTESVCKVGQGAKCCKYLIMAMNGWECMKADPADKKLIDDFYSDSTHNANGDNCNGYGK
jgi:hypothetical protein